MQRYRVLIPDGDCSFATAVVRALGREPCWDVLVLTKDHRASVTYSRYCRRSQWMNCSPEDYRQRYAEILHESIRSLKPDVLLPIHEPSIRLTSLHLAELRGQAAVANVPETDIFDIAVDKGRLAEFLRRHDLPHPPTVVAQSVQELDCRCQDLRFPVLVKPRRMAFGAGILRFNSPAELAQWISREHPEPGDFVVQQLMPGEDIDCSVLCDQGEILAWTIQAAFGPSGRNFRPPGCIQFVEDERVLETVRTVLRRLRWNGIAHLDLRYDLHREELYLLEINARYWGSLTGSVQAGVNFPALACRQALGQSAPAVRQSPVRYGSPSNYFADLWPFPGKSHDQKLSWMNTSLVDTLNDPLPELARLFSISKV